MKRSILPATVILILAMAVLTAPAAHAVNFYDGARSPQGTYFLTYTSLYLANNVTDAKGNNTKTDYGLTKASEILRLCYYSPEFVATALVPFQYMDVRSIKQQSAGLGDVSVGVGHFLPIKSFDILPMLFLKLPTGEYTQGKAVNVGSNQYDIQPMIFLYKAMGDFSIDAVAKYFFRLENPDTHVSPGDEFYLQALLGYKVTDKLKMGPSLSWMISRDQERYGVRVANSARQSFSAGTDIYYRFKTFGVTFTYLYDVYTENTTKGHFFQIKTVYHF